MKPIWLLPLLLAALCFFAACGGEDDPSASSGQAPDDDSSDDDQTDDDINDDDAGDDDSLSDDDTLSDDDSQGDDDTGADDDTAPDDDTYETFPPEEQTPLYEKGLILPVNSLECYPVGQPPTLECNHHGATVAELPDGTIAAVWYHGKTEGSPDARVIWSRLYPGETEWTWPELLVDDPDRSEGNPALWVAEDGTLFVFFVTIFGDTWSQSRVRLVKSTDDGDTWSDIVEMRRAWCWMTRHRPLRLDNGDLLLPMYNECLAYPVYFRSTDNFATRQWLGGRVYFLCRC